MEQQDNNTRGTGNAANSAQTTYCVNPYQLGPIPGQPPSQAPNLQALSAEMAHQHQLAYHRIHQQQQQLEHQLQAMWAKQYEDIDQATDFKNHSLPLARIKKIMKSDEDVRMISSEAPVIFAKACEMFILDLTARAWSHAEENKRRILQRSDVASAITRTDMFDFLVDVLPREDLPNDGNGLPPYYYMPQPQNLPHVGVPGMVYGQTWPQQPLPLPEDDDDS